MTGKAKSEGHKCPVCGGPREDEAKALCNECDKATCVHGKGLLDPCEACKQEGEDAKAREERSK